MTTKKEQEILEIIKNNPSIEQEDIAKMLNIKRSTVAVHITNLIKKGTILGRGYILSKDNYVVGIGAANIDIYGKSLLPLKTHYDHPSKITSNVGGVMRNISENLALLGASVKLISAVGDDIYGETILNQTAKSGVDVSNCLRVSNSSSSIFMQVLDENNDMHMALCDMSVNQKLDSQFFKTKTSIIQNAKSIIIDPSLKFDVIEELLDKYSDNVRFFIDPVSDEYAKKIVPIIHRFYCAKPNLTELEAIVGYKLNDDQMIENACRSLIDKGLNRIFVSLGSRGFYYRDKQKSIFKHLKPISNMVNASGAGDASVAAIVYSDLNDYDIDKTLDYALAAGIAAINSEKTINPDMSIGLLDKILKENKNEL